MLYKVQSITPKNTYICTSPEVVTLDYKGYGYWLGYPAIPNPQASVGFDIFTVNAGSEYNNGTDQSFTGEYNRDVFFDFLNVTGSYTKSIAFDQSGLNSSGEGVVIKTYNNSGGYTAQTGNYSFYQGVFTPTIGESNFEYEGGFVERIITNGYDEQGDRNPLIFRRTLGDTSSKITNGNIYFKTILGLKYAQTDNYSSNGTAEGFISVNGVVTDASYSVTNFTQSSTRTQTNYEDFVFYTTENNTIIGSVASNSTYKTIDNQQSENTSSVEYTTAFIANGVKKEISDAFFFTFESNTKLDINVDLTSYQVIAQRGRGFVVTPANLNKLNNISVIIGQLIEESDDIWQVSGFITAVESSELFFNDLLIVNNITINVTKHEKVKADIFATPNGRLRANNNSPLVLGLNGWINEFAKSRIVFKENFNTLFTKGEEYYQSYPVNTTWIKDMMYIAGDWRGENEKFLQKTKWYAESWEIIENNAGEIEVDKSKTDRFHEGMILPLTIIEGETIEIDCISYYPKK